MMVVFLVMLAAAAAAAGQVHAGPVKSMGRMRDKTAKCAARAAGARVSAWALKSGVGLGL